MGWVVLGGIALVCAVALWRYLRSFKKWPPTPGERRTFIWGPRGGGDM